MRDIKMTAKEAERFRLLAELNIHRYDDQLKIYKYVDAETAKKIFRNSTLKFSNPEQLNDNDMEIELLTINLNLKQLREKKTIAYLNALVEHGKLSIREAKNYLKTPEGIKKLARISTEAFRDVILQSYKSVHTTSSFFCATTSPANKKMWEKYADAHRGFCIEYKFPTFYTSAYLGFRVYYDKDFLPFDVYDNKGKEDEIAVYRWFFTKREQYAFEDEVRIVTIKEADIFEFPKEIFTGIYYGKETTQNDINDIESLLQNGYSFTRGQRIDNNIHF